MRADIVPGGTFPDYELPDHASTPRRLSELQGDDPLILTLARGHYCPKEHQQHLELALELAAFYSTVAVAYTRIVTISTDGHHTLQEFRASVGAQWTFLSDPDRTVQRDLDIYAPLAEFDVDKARRDVDAHLLLPLQVARDAASKVRLGGTLFLMGGTAGRRTAAGLAFISALTAALPALTKNLALELSPIRVNLIAAGFVDTPLPAAILGDQLDVRREQLRTTLPIRRVIGSADIAALAVHLMTNTAVTGATFDIDVDQQLVEE